MKKIRFKPEIIQKNEVIGISSLYADYKIAWSLNDTLKISLSKVEDISVEMKRNEKNEILNFSLFSFFNSDEDAFLLLSNQDKGKKLSLKYKNIDYFLFVKTDSVQMREILQRISNSDFINGSFILQADNVLKKIMSKIFEV
ncbi:MAG: IPExxxVDY family protein [Bacteroidales bacterium]|nr:IPExxxVDY family protein [Bacteroidales bacterium]